LSLDDTAVTDAGLEYLSLRRFTNLQELDLIGTRVTDQGVTKLKQALGDFPFICRDANLKGRGIRR
jgi:hypothetical protein